ncbi:asparaginase [Polymorphospora rubra]|uniref:asparaginase n=1 Tax=Polymorphospora rubra TaxID=338584 RepID=UPI0033F245FF
MTAGHAGPYAGGVPLAEVVRSGFVEGFHHGSVVVLDAAGRVLDAAGDVRAPVFPRSSAKPMQTLGMLRAGLPVTDPADLALVSASHHGEPPHLARVAALLHGAGLGEADLHCPPDLPIGAAAAETVLRAGGGPTRLRMNCSGKHAGMLLTCRAAGWPITGYWQPEHPLQRRLRATVEEFTGERVAATGVDGCGAPVLAVSLTGLATAFHRLVSAAPGTVERTVADAMRAYPAMVSGTGPDAEDNLLMGGIPGLLTKVGAEGVMAAALPGAGAVALKIDDGGRRARPPVLVSALRRLGVTAPVLAQLAEPPINGGGARVGEVRAVW